MPNKSTSAPALNDDAIRTRAYLLWEADGRPFGRDDHYWGLAQAEAVSAASVKPKRAAAVAKPAPEKKAKVTAKAAVKAAVKKVAAKVAKSKKK